MVTNPSNIEVALDAVPTRYLGGGDCKMWDYETQRDIYGYGNNQQASIHVIIVPAQWKPAHHFLSKTGTMDSDIYAPARSQTDYDYPTAKIYDGSYSGLRPDPYYYANYCEQSTNNFSYIFFFFLCEYRYVAIQSLV
jgi:hypothetical protein